MGEWRTVPLGEVVTFQRGYDLPHRDRKPGNVPLVSSAGITDYHDTAMIGPPGVVTGRYGTIGKVFLIAEPFWPLNTTLYIRDFHGNDERFIYYLLQRFDFASFSGKSGVPGVNRNDLHLEPVSLPNEISEQRAIAAALGDVDALLESLDRQIAKQRDLKQAAMQQLLTGQTRLPGFEGEWDMKRLGDHVTFLHNGSNSWAELTSNDPVKYLHYGDIHACTAVTLTPTDLPSLPSVKAKNLDRLRDGDLIFADASEDVAGIGKAVEICGVADTEFVSGLHTITARFDKNILADGFKGYLPFCPPFISQLRRLAAGTKVYATNPSHIASIEMQLPRVEEQIAIAAVLSDMDAEIAALERRRAKTRDLKQAMMQELLTGKTRLL